MMIRPHFVIRAAEVLNVSTDYLLRDTIPIESAVQPPVMAQAVDQLSFGKRLRMLRLQHHLSQRDIARLLGLASRAYIGGLETDRGKLPSLELVVRIADLFGIRTDDLLRGALPPVTSGSGSGKDDRRHA
jgi:DNA-binding XRE family transcriptional regulator